MTSAMTGIKAIQMQENMNLLLSILLKIRKKAPTIENTKNTPLYIE